MLHYICTVFDADKNVLRVEPFDAATDEGARDQGILLQLTTRNGAAFEVWAGIRKVACFYGKRAAWSTRDRKVSGIAGEMTAVVRASGRRSVSAVH
jgi:hypothetical protein